MSYGPSLTTVPKDLYYVDRKLVADQAAEIERLRNIIHDATETLLSICDGSNWPEYAQSGDGYKAYGEITEGLHEIAADIQDALNQQGTQEPQKKPGWTEYGG